MKNCNNQNHFEDLVITGNCYICGGEWGLGSKVENLKLKLNEAEKIADDILDAAKDTAPDFLKTDEELKIDLDVVFPEDPDNHELESDSKLDSDTLKNNL